MIQVPFPAGLEGRCYVLGTGHFKPPTCTSGYCGIGFNASNGRRHMPWWISQLPHGATLFCIAALGIGLPCHQTFHPPLDLMAAERCVTLGASMTRYDRSQISCCRRKTNINSQRDKGKTSLSPTTRFCNKPQSRATPAYPVRAPAFSGH